MIYVTGDLHGDFSALESFACSEDGKNLTKKDYVIVLGDFGIWPEKMEEIKALSDKLNYTLLFLDGNHEHHPLLQTFRQEQLFGGLVHNVFGTYHLCRGGIYIIPTQDGNVTIAVCGGGDSRDKDQRINNVDWFVQEKISEFDVDTLLDNAAVYNMQVDYFLSHSLSAAVKAEWNYECSSCSFCKNVTYEITESEYRIRDIVGMLKAHKYLSAHEHIDRDFCLAGKQYRSVYKDFVELELIINKY